MVICLHLLTDSSSLISASTEKLCKVEKLSKTDKQYTTRVELEHSSRSVDEKCSCARGRGNDHFHCPHCDVIIIHRHNIRRHVRTKHGVAAVRKDGECVSLKADQSNSCDCVFLAFLFDRDDSV
jgi:uncharacterized C2H2 Zn-finger protein